MADEDTTTAEAEENPETQPRKSLVRRALLPGVGAVISASLAVVMAGIVVPPTTEEEEPPKEENLLDLDQFAEPMTIDLGEFKFTLADEGRDGFARIFLAMEFRAVDPSVITSRLENELGIVVQDQMIMHLSGKVSTNLKTTEGKQLLKLELIDVLTPHVFENPQEGVITNLYYKDFLVQ
jgi:flagellar basal body-associated protein FliL